MVLAKLIDYRNKYPQLGLPRNEEEFFDTSVSTYEYLVETGFIEKLQTKSDISVILRTGGTSSLSYKILPSSKVRFSYNDNCVARKLLIDVLSDRGVGFVVDVLKNGVVFLPGNMFESDSVPMRYVSNALVSERGRMGDVVCPVPQYIFDGMGYSTSLEKMCAIAHCYKGRQPVVISGVPSVILQFAQEWYRLYDTHLRPQIVITGGCAVDPYISQLRATLGNDVVIIPYYNATEGTFGYQPQELRNSDDYETLQLKHDCGVWYELVDPDGQIISLSDAKLDIHYKLLVTTYDGLCRYELGDVIKMVDVEQSRIKIIGRTSEYIDIANEHTQIQHIQQTMGQLGNDYSFGQYCVFPSQDGGMWHYILVAEIDGMTLLAKEAQEDEIAEKFDAILGTQNHNYAAKRSGGTLGLAQVRVVEQGRFDDLIAQLNYERQSTQSKLLTLYPREDNPVNKKLVGE